MLSSSRAAIAESASIIPHVTTFDLADITELERLRKASGDGESGRISAQVRSATTKDSGAESEMTPSKSRARSFSTAREPSEPGLPGPPAQGC